MTQNEDSEQNLKRVRLEAEAEKLRAEARKASLEATKIQKDIDRPWFRRPLFLQAVTAGLVAVPLIWFYVKEVAIPLLESKNVKLVRQIEESRFELDQEQAKHKEAVETLIKEKEQSSRALLARFNDLRERYENLEKLQQTISTQYGTLLATHEVTKKDSDQLMREYEQVQSSLQEKTKILEGLNNEITVQKEQSANFSRQYAESLKRLTKVTSFDTSVYDKSFALIIGVGMYEDKSLPFLRGVSPDIEAMAPVLEGQGFEVIVETNPTRDAVYGALDKLKRKAGEHDRVIVYWSGHGLSTTESGYRRGYLVPSNGDIERPYESCFPMEGIIDVVERIGAKSVLAMIDASFAGLALPGTRGIRVIGNLQVYKGPRFSKEIIAASDRSGLVFDTSSEGLSPFAAAIVEGIGQSRADFNNDGVIRSSELFLFISTRVVQLSGGRQVPSYASLTPNAGEMLFGSSDNSKEISR